MNGALIIDGRSIASLAAVRSLGSRGIFVASGESFRHNYSFYSKYARRKIVYGEPSLDPAAFVQDVMKEIATGQYASILSFRDETNLILSQYRSEMQKWLDLCLPETEALLVGRDKGRTIRAAIAAGVPVPNTYFPEEVSIQEIARTASFPLLVRPRISSGARGIEYAESPRALVEKHEKVRRTYGEPIIQEYLAHTRDHLSACFLFNHASELRASFVYRELRQYPVNGGPASFAVSVKNAEVVAHGIQLLRSLGWKGVAHIDFLTDPKDGVPKLLEINPRFWMSLPLAIFCGVDFPYLLYQISVCGDVEPVLDYQTGFYYRWLLPADILWFLSVKKTWTTIREFMKFWAPNTCYAVLSRRDPGPVLGFLLQTLYFLSNKSRRDFILNRGW